MKFIHPGQVNQRRIIMCKAKTRSIFCDECKHYQATGIHQGDAFKDKCFHPDIFNRERYVPGTPITKGFTEKWTYPGDCMVKNKYNTCEIFEKMEYPDRTVG